MNKTNDNKKNSQLLKSISPFLQRVQEAHEELMASEGAQFVSRDVMEGCDSRLFIKPDDIMTLFHRCHCWNTVRDTVFAARSTS